MDAFPVDVSERPTLVSARSAVDDGYSLYGDVDTAIYSVHVSAHAAAAATSAGGGARPSEAGGAHSGRRTCRRRPA